MKRIIVMSSIGKGKTLLREKGKHNAALGISLSKRFFSKENVKLYCEWANQYCNKFLISLEDHEEMYNYMVFKNLSLDEALQRAMEQGKTLEKGLEKVLLNYDKQKFCLQRSSTLFNNQQFLRIKSIIYKTYQTETKFKEDIYTQLNINLGWKIIPWKETVSENKYSEGIKILANYLLEEIAVVIFFQYIQDFSVDVYPSPPMEIINNLYARNYKLISKTLHLPKQYDYIYLTLE